MSVTVYFANITKRRNSTLQGTFTTSYDCVFKTPTSLDRPTFLVSAATMDYNAAKMGDRYYFIDDVVSVRQGQWEVTCVLDVLATYKTEILASTQFVSYSSVGNDTFLEDTRIPVLRSETAVNEVIDTGDELPFDNTGFYALTATGKDGTKVYALDEADIHNLIAEVSNWAQDSIADILSGSYAGITYNWNTEKDTLKSAAEMATQTSFLGNSYANAPQNIRSCIWLPLIKANFIKTGTTRIYLGDFDTLIDAPEVDISPYAHTVQMSIPWQYNDWRRTTCESLCLYLPYAGCVNIPVDIISSETVLKIRYSISPTDGTVAYLVYAGASFNIIGTYGGKLGGDYAIGINQQASIGEIVQTAFAGFQKSVNSVIQSSISPASAVAGAVGATLSGIETAYNIKDTAMSTHPTTIGSFGGCAATPLTYGVIVLVSVAHGLATTPASMASTMGLPTMKPMSLSGLTGFCQCANAHVAAAAQAQELDAIDRYLNSGFFIE